MTNNSDPWKRENDEPVGTLPTDDPGSRFRSLADQWREETGMLSSNHQMERHPAYREIIQMGEAAIPLILQELEERPYHWFGALVTLTGDNPVPPEDAGYIQKMTVAWIGWGQQKGYISHSHDSGTT